MNDFSKEELGIIACNLCINPKTVNILIKLEYMLNNYCEHSNKEESLLFADVCVDCGFFGRD
jgi:hypothetical protein